MVKPVARWKLRKGISLSPPIISLIARAAIALTFGGVPSQPMRLNALQFRHPYELQFPSVPGSGNAGSCSLYSIGSVGARFFLKDGFGNLPITSDKGGRRYGNSSENRSAGSESHQ